MCVRVWVCVCVCLCLGVSADYLGAICCCVVCVTFLHWFGSSFAGFTFSVSTLFIFRGDSACSEWAQSTWRTARWPVVRVEAKMKVFTSEQTCSVFKSSHWLIKSLTAAECCRHHWKEEFVFNYYGKLKYLFISVQFIYCQITTTFALRRCEEM